VAPERAFALAITLLFAVAACGCAFGTPGEGVAASRLALNVCPAGAVVDGIDVSRWQGTIDWGSVGASGLDFAITRVGDGFYEDPTFDGNYAAIRAQGMVRGSYQFFRPNSDAVAQADIVIRHVGVLGAGDLPPVIDVENTPGEALPSAAVMRSQVRAWMDRVQMALGRTPMIYTGSYFWDDNVTSTDYGDVPLWIAHWGVTCPRMPAGWLDWRFHQTSSTGSIPGITGNVDTDVFNGTRADLDAFAAVAGCSAHCEGDVVVAADCGRGDCTAFGATCVDDAIGVRCVSVFCPAMGVVDACMSTTTVAHCTDGMLGMTTECLSGESCIDDGAGARCSSGPLPDGGMPLGDGGYPWGDGGGVDGGPDDPGGRVGGGGSLSAGCGCRVADPARGGFGFVVVGLVVPAVVVLSRRRRARRVTRS